MKNCKITFDKPATVWEEAFPLGNGQIGAMVYGGVDHEIIQFNHDTFWSGCLRSPKLPGQIAYLSAVKELLKQQNYAEAMKTLNQMDGVTTDSYLPVGFLHIRFQEIGGIYQDYRRSLSMEDAVMDVEYTRKSWRDPKNDPHFRRQVFLSKPHDVLVMRIRDDNQEAMAGRSIRLTAGLESDVPCKIYEEQGILYMEGRAPSRMLRTLTFEEKYLWYDEGRSVGFRLGIKPVQSAGTLRFVNNHIVIENAREAVFYISLKTDFRGFDQEPGGEMDCAGVLERAAAAGYEAVKAAHLQDYRNLFNRSGISVTEENRDAQMMDRRLQYFRSSAQDPGLAELLFNFGKYLLIAGSREGTQPTPLFGIWSGIFRQQWQGGYTVNINTQMNYWGAEIVNLSECHLPLLEMTQELSITGERVAREYFGCGGFCANHNTDLWRTAFPISGGMAVWPMAGGWFCQHLWEHYQFTGDESFLRETAFPVSLKAAEFFLDWMVTDENGYYLTAPSVSPENRFYDETDHACGVGMGCAMDMTIIRELFGNLLTMGELLGTETPVLTRIRQVLPKLYPLQIGEDGRLLEWHVPLKEVEPGHRHLSHLYGLYPSDLINQNTPELLRAAEKSLEYRLLNGGGHTGWSSSWIICLFARLRRGNDCERTLGKMLQTLFYDNLMDSQPPFQIDGNYGVMAGICEMLLQSTHGQIVLLPALPDSWKAKGSFYGLRARGDVTVSASWEKGYITGYRMQGKTYSIERENVHLPFGYTVALQDLPNLTD